MEYNHLGQVIRSDGLQRSYDHKGRLLSETFPQNLSLYNTYSQGKRIASSIPAADCDIEYTYIGNNLHTVARKAGTQTLYTHTYDKYDHSGHPLQEQLIGNLGTIQHDLDPRSLKRGILSPYFQAQVLKFDPIGNICEMHIQNQMQFYEYDDLYQLTAERGAISHDYQYDSLNNRLQKDSQLYEINTLNQIVSHLEYDPNGNPIRDGDTHFTYDALDRLIQIETPTCTQTFKYDCFHRCLSKNDSRTGTQYFLYDGQKEIGSFDDNLQIQELRILGHAPHAEIGAAIAIELQGEIYAPIHDLQDNVAALIPLYSGTPTHYRYSAFGEEQRLGSVLSPWRFSSKRTDADTGLVYFGRRFYSPNFGRWLTPDPAGFADGMNLYAYVHNDPLTHFDEYGLWDWESSNLRNRYYEPAKSYLVDTWNSPRFQGALMVGMGTAEVAGAAYYSTFGTAGIGVLAGGGMTMGIALDIIYTGYRQIRTNQFCDTGTLQFFKGCGVPEKYASFADAGLGMYFGRYTAPAPWRSLLGNLLGRSPVKMGRELLSLGSGRKIQDKLNLLSQSFDRGRIKISQNQYRKHFINYIGFDAEKAAEVHHMFPKQERGRFARMGIDVDDPRYLTWVEKSLHGEIHNKDKYNQEWIRFVIKENPSRERIMQKARELAQKYGYYAEF